MTKRKIKIAEDLTIVDIGHKGMCIAKGLDGRIYLVRGGVPGDLVDVGIRRKKKGLPFGDVVELKKPSEFRTNPVCEHFGSCGGCKWQDLEYSKQAELKEKQVFDAITRIAHIEDAEMEPILTSAMKYGYRNKMEYTFTNRRYLSDKEVQSKEDFADRRGLGFHRTGAFDQVVDITRCHLQDDIGDKIRNRVNDLAKDLSIAYYDNRAHFGILRNLIIRTNTKGEAMVTVVIAEDMPSVAERLLSPLVPEFEKVKSWNYVVNSKVNDSLGDCHSINLYEAKHLTETIGEKDFIISPLSFFQTNSWQAEKLYDLVKEYAVGVSDHYNTIYDLYCGTGSIGIYLSDIVDELIGIEINPDAIRDAKINVELNGITNSKFFVGDVIDVVNDKFVAEHGEADLIITDPPRAGMHGDLLDFLKSQKNKHLIYVSCNPSTLARDIEVLSDTYTLVKYRAVDMFPHTSHIETVALLERK